MIDIDEVIAVHDRQIEHFGGLPGLRGKDLLEAVIASPYMSFDNKELYPTDAAKAARLGYEMITQHPFADANKRTAAVLIIAYMRLCGYKFKPRSEDFYEIIYGVAEGSFGFEDILHFVENAL